MRRYLEGPVIDQQKVAALHIHTGWDFADCEKALRKANGNWYTASKRKTT